MKKNILTAITLLGITAAAIITVKKVRRFKAKLVENTDGLAAIDKANRHIPHGRHTISRKRAHELSASGNAAV